MRSGQVNTYASLRLIRNQNTRKCNQNCSSYHVIHPIASLTCITDICTDPLSRATSLDFRGQQGCIIRPTMYKHGHDPISGLVGNLLFYGRPYLSVDLHTQPVCQSPCDSRTHSAVIQQPSDDHHLGPHTMRTANKKPGNAPKIRGIGAKRE